MLAKADCQSSIAGGVGRAVGVPPGTVTWLCGAYMAEAVQDVGDGDPDCDIPDS